MTRLLLQLLGKVLMCQQEGCYQAEEPCETHGRKMETSFLPTQKGNALLGHRGCPEIPGCPRTGQASGKRGLMEALQPGKLRCQDSCMVQTRGEFHPEETSSRGRASVPGECWEVNGYGWLPRWCIL